AAGGLVDADVAFSPRCGQRRGRGRGCVGGVGRIGRADGVGRLDAIEVLRAGQNRGVAEGGGVLRGGADLRPRVVAVGRALDDVPGLVVRAGGPLHVDAGGIVGGSGPSGRRGWRGRGCRGGRVGDVGRRGRPAGVGRRDAIEILRVGGQPGVAEGR